MIRVFSCFIILLTLIPSPIWAQLFSEQIIISTAAEGARSVHCCDLDNDGDMDIIAACDAGNKVIWFENTDGLGTFSSPKIIAIGTERAWSVYAADMDCDGDQDVLAVALFRNEVCWYENTDGKGNISTKYIISTQVTSPTCIYAADLDGDADIDVLTASSGDDKIAWYENTDGKGNFGPQKALTAQTEQASYVTAADVDGDGDLDILAAAYHINQIVWFKNTDGKGLFSAGKVVTTTCDQVEALCAVDLDKDNDLDILIASWGNEVIAWYANTNGKGAFGPQQALSSTGHIHNSVFAADLDGDLDMDVLSASTDDLVAWYENLDGTGTFSSSKTISTTADDAMDVCAADLDNDGDQDVISASWFDNKIAWYKNLSTTSIQEKTQNNKPECFWLEQNYPNPFNNSTVIACNLVKPAWINIEVYDLCGRLVKQIYKGYCTAGRQEFKWQPTELATGVYICRLTTEQTTLTGKMLLMR